jgi:hypothetical protein
MTPEERQLHVARQQYSLALQGVLTDFQFIEEGLRMYISSAYDLIRMRLKSDLPFQLNDKSLEKDSLGKLITKFSQLSDNSDLLKTMNSLVPRRNDCAHRGFLSTAHPSTKVEELEQATAELGAIKKETSACFNSLVNEVGRPQGFLTTAI